MCFFVFSIEHNSVLMCQTNTYTHFVYVLFIFVHVKKTTQFSNLACDVLHPTDIEFKFFKTHPKWGYHLM